MARIVSALFFVGLVSFGNSLEMKNQAYEDFTITLTDAVPATNCKDILNNLEVSPEKFFEVFIGTKFKFSTFNYLYTMELLVTDTSNHWILLTSHIQIHIKLLTTGQNMSPHRCSVVKSSTVYTVKLLFMNTPNNRTVFNSSAVSAYI